MATASRAIDSDLEKTPLREALEKEPFRFQFFQAVRLLNRLSPERRMVGDFVHPSAEVVRFASRQSLAFPASEIHSIEFRDQQAPRMTVNFMGLTGPEGVLPLAYTEFIIERMQRRDTAAADFFDIFNHRILSFFYQAWEKYRFAVSYERGESDHISQALGDLIGLGTAGLQKRLEPDVSDDTLLHYAGVLAQRPHSAVALEQLLADYFDVPVSIKQFAGIWHRVDPRQQTCLDEGNSPFERLGLGALVGDEIWDQQSLVRIRLGPLSLDRYLEFLPTGSAHKSLCALLRFYAGQELDFEVQLVLQRDETPPLVLGGQGRTAPRLGWLSWVRSVPLDRQPDETIIRL